MVWGGGGVDVIVVMIMTMTTTTPTPLTPTIGSKHHTSITTDPGPTLIRGGMVGKGGGGGLEVEIIMNIGNPIIIIPPIPALATISTNIGRVLIGTITIEVGTGTRFGARIAFFGHFLSK